MARLGSSISSPRCRLLFHMRWEEIVIGHYKTFMLPELHYLHWPIFCLLNTLFLWGRPSHLSSLGTIDPTGLPKAFLSCGIPSLTVIIPLVTFACLFVFWGGTGRISESEWSVEFAEWKINMLYPSMHSKCWWRLRFLTKPAVNTVSSFIRWKGQMILKLGVVNFLWKLIQIDSELQPKAGGFLIKWLGLKLYLDSSEAVIPYS